MHWLTRIFSHWATWALIDCFYHSLKIFKPPCTLNRAQMLFLYNTSCCSKIMFPPENCFPIGHYIMVSKIEKCMKKMLNHCSRLTITHKHIACSALPSTVPKSTERAQCNEPDAVTWTSPSYRIGCACTLNSLFMFSTTTLSHWKCNWAAFWSINVTLLY